MKKFSKHIITIAVLAVTFTLGLAGLAYASHATVNLGTADSFAILAGSTVTDANPSDITGDVGLSPATGAGILVPCAEVDGTIFSVDAAGPLPCRVTNPGLLTTAKNDLTTAYNDAAGRSATTIGTELAGATLADGTYVTDSTTFEIAGAGTLTLDGQGNPNAVFIFQMGTTLVTGSSSTVVLTGGAQACNVFWQVGSSATLGTGSNFVGTIMADQSITDDGGSTVEGRLLARIAAVNLNDTTVTVPACAGDNPSDNGGGSSDGTPVPGLPNAGVAPQSKNLAPWSVIIPAGIVVALSLFYLARKRRAL